MKLLKFIESRIKHLKWYDLSQIKLASVFFGLLVAKLWPAVLAMDWPFYFCFMALFSVKPICSFYGRAK